MGKHAALLFMLIAASGSASAATATSPSTAACDNGDASACASLGDSYVNADGVARDGTRAASFYLKACNLKMARACLFMSSILESGDVGRTLEFYRKACGLGFQAGCAHAKIVEGH